MSASMWTDAEVVRILEATRYAKTMRKPWVATYDPVGQIVAQPHVDRWDEALDVHLDSLIEHPADLAAKRELLEEAEALLASDGPTPLANGPVTRLLK